MFTVLEAKAQSRIAAAVASVSDGTVSSISVTDGGVGYTFIPKISIVGGGGAGAKASCIVVDGSVNQIIISEPGLNYFDIPSVYIEPPTGWSRDGLMAEYLFDSNYLDTSSKGLNLIGENLLFSVDRFGRPDACASFDGLFAQAYLYDPVFNIGQTEYSINFWVSINDENDTLQGIFNTIPHTGVAIVYNNTWAPNQISYWLGDAVGGWQVNYRYGTPKVYQSQKWYFVSFQKNNNEYRFYVNGKLLDSYTFANSFDYPVGLRLGSTAQLDGQYFAGLLDDLRIFNRTLSERELASLLADGSGPEDADGDGLSDYLEIYLYETDPNIPDTDGDGLSDGSEVNTYNTDPTLADTDNDGFTDKVEIDMESNPLDRNSCPLPKLAVTRSVKLDLFLKEGLLYQLECARDATNWVSFESSFTATTNVMSRYIDVNENQQYWRLRLLPQ